MCIHVQELLPQVRAVDAQLPQFTQRLQRAAPAGYPPEDVIQPAPVKSSCFAIPQAVRLRHPPLHERVVQILASVDFVGGDPHILCQLVFPPQLTQMSVDHMSFQSASTPATGMGRPTEAPIRYQLCVWPSRVLVEILLCRQRGFQPGDGSADGLLQPVQVVIYLWKLPPGIAVQDLIDGTVFFYETKKHRRRVFSARQRCNSVYGFAFSCGNATSFSNTTVTSLGLLHPAWSS